MIFVRWALKFQSLMKFFYRKTKLFQVKTKKLMIKISQLLSYAQTDQAKSNILRQSRIRKTL